MILLTNISPRCAPLVALSSVTPCCRGETIAGQKKRRNITPPRIDVAFTDEKRSDTSFCRNLMELRRRTSKRIITMINNNGDALADGPKLHRALFEVAKDMIHEEIHHGEHVLSIHLNVCVAEV